MTRCARRQRCTVTLVHRLSSKDIDRGLAGPGALDDVDAFARWRLSRRAAGVGGTRALRFELLDRCCFHAVLLGGNGSGHDNMIVDPQTLILILRDAREIDVDALA